MLQKLAAFLRLDFVDFDQELAHLKLDETTIFLGFLYVPLQVRCNGTKTKMMMTDEDDDSQNDNNHVGDSDDVGNDSELR